MKKETFFLKQMSVLAFALFSAISCSNDREFLGATENVAPKKCMSPSNTRTIEEAKTIAADFLAHSMKIDSSKPNPMRAQAQPPYKYLQKIASQARLVTRFHTMCCPTLYCMA